MENNLSLVKDTFKELPNNIEAEQAVIGSILVFEKPINEILIDAECKSTSSQENNMNYKKDIHDLNKHEANYQDDDYKSYFSNRVAQNLMNRIDNYEDTVSDFKSIVDYKMDQDAQTTKDYLLTKSGQKQYRKSTIGWKMMV